jgi:hypothetical protein
MFCVISSENVRGNCKRAKPDSIGDGICIFAFFLTATLLFKGSTYKEMQSVRKEIFFFSFLCSERINK